jgi:predicted dehydrogenase
MMEKPLAVDWDRPTPSNMPRPSGIPVLVNYETTWYASNHAAYRAARATGELGEVRKVVFHDGHRGPKEIGVQPEFLDWLIDPRRNGGGAPLRLRC